MPTLPTIPADTALFAVLGHPVGHSLSPAFQTAGLRAMGVQGVYTAIDVPPESLPEVLITLKEAKAAGVNLTIPLKERAVDLMDTVADSAREAGSVNTVVFGEGGALTGHSTDGVGLHLALTEAFGTAFAEKTILILGCGGAGRAAALQAAREGASCLLLANRTLARAHALQSELEKTCPGVAVDTLPAWPPMPEQVQAADLIIQSTSLGMNATDDLPVGPDHFREGQCLLDMTYVSALTPVMAVAQQAGAQVTNGLGMLLHQGVASLRLWTGQEPPVEIMRQALADAMAARGAADAH